jgi:thiol-disulfide isomerase/thioredoxin
MTIAGAELAMIGGGLRGKVVLIDFCTYTCINSIRPLPYLRNSVEKHKAAGFVVIGVHTPEFSFEHEPARRASNFSISVSPPTKLNVRLRMFLPTREPPSFG